MTEHDIAAAHRQGYRTGVERGLIAGLTVARTAVGDLLADPLPVDGLVEQNYTIDTEGETMAAVNEALTRGTAHIQQAIRDQDETRELMIGELNMIIVGGKIVITRADPHILIADNLLQPVTSHLKIELHAGLRIRFVDGQVTYRLTGERDIGGAWHAIRDEAGEARDKPGPEAVASATDISVPYPRSDPDV
jgi:hypothetical protein